MESSAKGESDETESSAVNEVESGAAETNTESSVAEVNTTQTSKPPKRKSGKDGKPKKKPRLCDVEQSNEQMKQMQDYMQSNSVTLKDRSKEREEDREFFRQMLGMMSQTMMGMTQMLVQGAGSGGYHPLTQAYSPQSVQPNYSFPPSGMGYGFHSPPARPSSASSVTSEPSDYYSL